IGFHPIHDVLRSRADHLAVDLRDDRSDLARLVLRRVALRGQAAAARDRWKAATGLLAGLQSRQDALGQPDLGEARGEVDHREAARQHLIAPHRLHAVELTGRESLEPAPGALPARAPRAALA